MEQKRRLEQEKEKEDSYDLGNESTAKKEAKELEGTTYPTDGTGRRQRKAERKRKKEREREGRPEPMHRIQTKTNVERGEVERG